MSQLSSANPEELDFTSNSPISPRESRRTYLLTYSKADMERFPDCTSFANCILEAFDSGKSSAKVVQWATCIENHTDGKSKHFHMAVKLSATRRWYAVSKYLQDKHKIQVNFSNEHCGYVAAYRYVCKDKDLQEVLHSPGHTNLSQVGSPRTKNAMNKFSANARKCRSEEPTPSSSSSTKPKVSKPKRLSNTDIAEFLIKNNLKTENELMVVAKKRHDDGERDIYSFIMNKSPKALSDLVNTTWKLQNAQHVEDRISKSRIDILKEHINGPCTANCSGEWFACAREVLRNNNINLYTFADSVRQCLIKGRQKRNNIMLVGPTNCGKSFLLNPLEIIYKAFVNPSSTSYAWIGLDEHEVAYLNDFRYTPECIKWSDFLLLLEGQTVNLPRPKNQFSTDLKITRDNTIPFFATSKSPIEYVSKYNFKDDRETEMMSSRWNVFTFNKQISPEKMKNLPPCPHCFSALVMQGSEMDS